MDGAHARWQQYYYAHDQTPHYALFAQGDAVDEWMKGPNRWVMKSPPNMESLIPFVRCYPDATVVITHRDPVAVIAVRGDDDGVWDRVRRNDMSGALAANGSIASKSCCADACVRDHDKRCLSKQMMDMCFTSIWRISAAPWRVSGKAACRLGAGGTRTCTIII